MIDLSMAMYSHCEPFEGRPLPIFQSTLLELGLARVLEAPHRVRRIKTFLQGPIAFLGERAEFRMHCWISLPKGHPLFTRADRGLVAFVQAVGERGLYGPIRGEVGWLARPLEAQEWSAPIVDWVDAMIREQGYRELAGSEWSCVVNDSATRQLQAFMLARHLEGMTSRAILEAQLEEVA